MRNQSFCLAAIIFISTTSNAAPFYSAVAGQRAFATNGPSACASLPAGMSTGPASCSTPIAISNGFGSGSATSRASNGSVAASIEITASNGIGQGIGSATIAGGYASASATFDDLIISGPAQSAVTTTANFSVDGTSVFLPGIGAAGIVQGGVSIEIFDPFLEGGYTFDIAGNSFVNTAAEIGALELSVGVPLTVEMYINLEVEIGDTRTADEAFNPTPNQTFVSADFGNTVSFAKSGPVFDLPEGYTVNSVSANIVNNQWISPVPVPAAIWLFASALLGLVVLKRKIS